MLGPLTQEQLRAAALEQAITDVSELLRTKDFTFDPEPETVAEFDSFGRQTNKREQRLYRKAKIEQTDLVQQAFSVIPSYKPPKGFQPLYETSGKVYLPVDKHPQLNFVGLLIGPRGKTLQRMESESGARIALRGRGSSKNSQYEKDALHCTVAAETPEAYKNARRLINEIVQAAITQPEDTNSHKRNQLRELAALNGTLREDGCTACGSLEHKRHECNVAPKKFTCRLCGREGHFARDCTNKKRPNSERPKSPENLVDSIFDELDDEEEGGSRKRPKPVAAKRPEDALTPSLLLAPLTDAPPGIIETGPQNPQDMELPPPPTFAFEETLNPPSGDMPPPPPPPAF